MKNSSFWPATILFFFLVFLVTACGPAGSNAADGASSADDSGLGAVTQNTAVSETDNISNPESVEYGTDGLEVGFTEDGHPYRGSRNAPVVLEEFSDYQCPFCARFFAQTLPSIKENQIANGEVVLIFYDFPLTSIHPQAVAAANAARCAGEQGATAYWDMHDLIFANADAWANNNAVSIFSGYAQQLGLDINQFDDCQTANKYETAIQDDLNLGLSRGVNSTPSFFINNQPLIGAQPLSVFNQAIATVSDGAQIASSAPEPPPSDPSGQPAVAPTPATIPLDDFAGAMGDPDAPITIVEYTDYQCPFCQRHSLETMPQLISEMVETGRVYYILKDFPLDNLHPDARAAAVAARCAGEQDRYWEMHDAIFLNQSSWAGQGAAQVLAGLAAELGLDTASYNECVNSGRHDAVIQANLVEGSNLGVRGTPAFFINGFPISGAQPFSVFEYGIGLAEEGTLADAFVQQQPEPQPTAVPEPSGPVDVPIDDAYSLGDPDAPVTVVEFTDFQCPFCSRHFQQTFPQIKENFIDTGLVRYVFKDFPLTNIHPQAAPAALAARCAGDQDAYVEMHDILFTNQDEWAGRQDLLDLFTGYAERLKLDTAVFSECLTSNTHVPAVQSDFQEGLALGINGTPAFFINGNFVSGAQPYSVFEQVINSQLNSQ